MLQRLILALLVACLAVPSMAQGAMPECHDENAGQHVNEHAMSGHEGQEAPAPADAQHECIGCVCPGHGVRPMAEHTAYIDLPKADRGDLLFHAAAPPPDTPPPRA